MCFIGEKKPLQYLDCWSLAFLESFADHPINIWYLIVFGSYWWDRNQWLHIRKMTRNAWSAHWQGAQKTRCQ